MNTNIYHRFDNIAFRHVRRSVLILLLLCLPSLSVRAQNTKCALYKVYARSYCITDNYIYYVEENKNNAVMRIDRKTGDISTVVPGIEGIYEGARQRIKKVRFCSGKLLLEKENGHFDTAKVWIYDGKSVKTSPVINDASEILAVCGDYVLTGDYDGTTSMISYWDMKNLRRVKRIEKYDSGFHNSRSVVTPDGSFWTSILTYPSNEQVLNRVKLDGKTENYNFKQQAYVAEYIKENNRTLDISYLAAKGNYIYVALGRRIYRMNIFTSEIIEYAKIPATMPGNFGWFCVDDKGNMFAMSNSGIHYWQVGSFDSPMEIGKGTILTGFKKWGAAEIWVGLHGGSTDADGNLISVSNDGIFIYNPKGVVGYKNAVGNIINQKK